MICGLLRLLYCIAFLSSLDLFGTVQSADLSNFASGCSADYLDLLYHSLYSIYLPLILEFRGKFLRIARDIARKISWIARGIARQLRGLRGIFRQNSPRYCVTLKKFRTNFKVLHGQNPKNLPPSANSI